MNILDCDVKTCLDADASDDATVRAMQRIAGECQMPLSWVASQLEGALLFSESDDLEYELLVRLESVRSCDVKIVDEEVSRVDESNSGWFLFQPCPVWSDDPTWEERLLGWWCGARNGFADWIERAFLK